MVYAQFICRAPAVPNLSCSVELKYSKLIQASFFCRAFVESHPRIKFGTAFGARPMNWALPFYGIGIIFTGIIFGAFGEKNLSISSG